jgi:hypothetical protein
VESLVAAGAAVGARGRPSGRGAALRRAADLVLEHGDGPAILLCPAAIARLAAAAMPDPRGSPIARAGTDGDARQRLLRVALRPATVGDRRVTELLSRIADEDPDPLLRMCAVDALGRLGAADTGVVDVVMRASRDDRQRGDHLALAVHALGGIAAVAAAAVPPLRERAVGAAGRAARRVAPIALLQLDAADPAVRTACADLLSDPDPGKPLWDWWKAWEAVEAAAIEIPVGEPWGAQMWACARSGKRGVC